MCEHKPADRGQHARTRLAKRSEAGVVRQFASSYRCFIKWVVNSPELQGFQLAIRNKPHLPVGVVCVRLNSSFDVLQVDCLPL